MNNAAASLLELFRSTDILLTLPVPACDSLLVPATHNLPATPPALRSRQRDCAHLRHRPDEVAALKRLCQQAQADAVVPKKLDPRPALLPQEGRTPEMPVERVMSQHLLRLHGQTSHPATHVCSAAGKMNPDTRRRGDHCCTRAANTRRNASSFTFVHQRAHLRTTRRSTISICPSSSAVGDVRGVMGAVTSRCGCPAITSTRTKRRRRCRPSRRARPHSSCCRHV